jgi:3-methyladenine DNA glycosylase/8-oxoguanine DNA glycosylase
MAAGNKTGGRQKGTPNKATAEVRDLALAHGPDAVEELARLSKEAQSETARISACSAILERAYGKAVPGRMIQLSLPDTSDLAGVSKAVAAVVQAMANGEISPAEAGDLCGILDTQRRAIELSDIETRLAKLEAAQGQMQ